MEPSIEEVAKYLRLDVEIWRLWRHLKVVGATSDGISNGDSYVLRRTGEFCRIWIEPIL